MRYTPYPDLYPNKYTDEGAMRSADAPTAPMDSPAVRGVRQWIEPPVDRPGAWPVEPVEPVGPVEQEVTRRATPSLWTVGRVGLVIYILLGVLDALLAIRFALKLLAANPSAGFSSFIYGMTEPFVAPFYGVFPTPALNNNVLEIPTLLAIAVYGLLAWMIAHLVKVLVSRWPGRTVY